MSPAPPVARALSAALRLLTVLPLPARRGEEDVRPLAVTLFPLAGLVLGLPLAACALLPLPVVPRAVLVLALWTVLTGGLHEDGWADSADAALAPVGRTERARILKDPRVGAHGVTATVLLFLVRFAGLTAAPAVVVGAAPVVGRWAMAVSLALAPPLSREGLGARYGRGASSTGPTLTALAVLVPAALLTGTVPAVLLGWAGGGAAAWAAGRFLVARLGGLNGDGHGAVGLAAETAALWAPVYLAGGAP